MTTLAAEPPLPPEVSDRYPHGYAVVDVETSGLSAAADRVLQIAIAQVAPNGTVQETWSTLLDPGCDPGPVHVHGLTRERLAGSPQYAEVAAHVAALTADRVLVAHNARFDWSFLAAEAQRGTARLDVRHRLCTMALTRRLDVPVPDLRLSSVAGYWGVSQARPHDAVDDTRVVVEVLRHSLALAHRLDAALPLSTCVGRSPALPARAPRIMCAWRYPGVWSPGTPLRQGMKVVFSGDTAQPRESLIRAATARGLDVMNNVSSRTSLLVCDLARTRTRKAAAAAQHGTPVVTEQQFLGLLESVAPGDPRTTSGDGTRAAATTRRPEKRPPASHGPLHRHRVLVIGGSHDERAAMRERIGSLGGQTAANLTASVTHVIRLDDAPSDPRHVRALDLRLPELDREALTPDRHADLTALDTGVVTSVDAAPAPTVLPRGGVADLPEGIHTFVLGVAWPDPRASGGGVDVVAFVTDADEQVTGDADFCFYSQPTHPSGCVDLDLDGANEALAVLRLRSVPDDTSRIIIAAATDGAHTFGDVGPVELALRDEHGQVHVRATLDAATEERSLELAYLYRRGGVWRFRAVGQGYADALPHLAVLHGVDVED